MKLNDIVNRVAQAYPDETVLQYWDPAMQCAVDNRGGGDGLAEFVAWEIYETFDPDAGDEAQIQTAIDKMRTAAQELQAVVVALESLARERSLKPA